MNCVTIANGVRQRFPRHWKTLALRRVVSPGQQGMKIGPFGSQLKLEDMDDSGRYKVYGQENVIADDFWSGRRLIADEKFAELKPCEIKPGDVVVTMMGTAGRCAVVPEGITPGVMDSHLLRLRPDRSIVIPRFLVWLLDEAPYVKHDLLSRSKGSIMQGLNSSILRDTAIGVPPVNEQRTIVDFLDHETEKIDSLIRLNREFVRLVDQQLDAQKNYVLTGKTRGPCKGSGVKWIGDVPGTWQVAPIGRIARLIETGPFGSQLHASDYEPGGVPVINPAHLVGGRIAADEKSAVSRSTANRLRRHQLMEGDLILARRGEVGRCAIVQSGEVGWLCGTGSMKLRLTQDNDPEYFNLLMSCSGPLEQLLLHSVGSTMPNVNPTIMSRLVVPVPPLSEQRDIVAEVSQIILRANRLKNSIASVVDLLTEYRSALISAAVTGQIEVRTYRPQEAAALCQ